VCIKKIGPVGYGAGRLKIATFDYSRNFTVVFFVFSRRKKL
jgi:hypothetical protein